MATRHGDLADMPVEGSTSLAEAVGKLKTVPQHRYDEATYLFG